jgi:hypothetical protein
LDRELRRLLTARRVRAAQQCRVARHASAPDRGHTSERRSSGIRLRRKGLRVIKARLSGTRPLRSDPPHRRNTIPHRARAVRAVLVAAADCIVLAVVAGPAAPAAVDTVQAVTAAVRCASVEHELALSPDKSHNADRFGSESAALKISALARSASKQFIMAIEYDGACRQLAETRAFNLPVKWSGRPCQTVYLHFGG